MHQTFWYILFPLLYDFDVTLEGRRIQRMRHKHITTFFFICLFVCLFCFCFHFLNLYTLPKNQRVIPPHLTNIEHFSPNCVWRIFYVLLKVIAVLYFPECKAPLGVERSNIHPHGAVQDDQMTATSFDIMHPAHYGRRDHSIGWCPSSSIMEEPVAAKSQYLQIDFIKVKRIKAILTQGLFLNGTKTTTKYYLYYAVDLSAFHILRHGPKKMVRDIKIFSFCSVLLT